MRVDEDTTETLDAEPLNEAHAPHVGRRIVDFGGAFAGSLTVLSPADVHAQAFYAGNTLVPVGKRLFANSPDPGESALMEVTYQRADNKATGYQIACAYADGNDANAVRTDPMFKLGLERLPLAASTPRATRNRAPVGSPSPRPPSWPA